MAETQRMSALKSLANQLPVANRRIATQQQAARDIQLQQAAAQSPVGPSAPKIAPVAQQTGAAVAQMAGEQQVQAAQQTGQQLGQVADVALGEQKLANTAQIAGQQAGLREQQMSNVDRFAKLNRGLKKELYDDEMQFKRDQIGRTLFSERQLIDYAAQNARDEEEFKNYAQSAEQVSARKIQVLNNAYEKVMQQLDIEFKKAEQQKDQQTKLEIIQMQKDAKEAQRRAINKERNKGAAWRTAGALAGAGIAAYASGGQPQAIQAGAQTGGAVGGGVAAST